MAEPRTARRMRFTADTIEGLRDQLNRWADEMADEFETENLITKGVQFIPVRGPYYKGGAPQGLMFLRKYEYDVPALTQHVYVVLPHPTITEVLQVIGSGPASNDADGVNTTGGLHD